MTDARHPLTIGRLAAYAGVTIKAVRVYHARGLLPEPPRDASGYRRYGAEHAIQLVKIRTLAEAGVPLARIRDLLDAAPDAFAAAIEEIDRALVRRAEEIRRTRRRIAELRTGDRLFVTADVATYLERLREIGVSDRTVTLERDLWIMLQPVAPDAAAAWIADKLTAIQDPEFRALCLAYDAAFDWPPDDPRIPALADRTRRWYARQPTETEPASTPDGPAAALATITTATASPAWARIADLSR
ncbi:MerR family transcriptional regulator [Catenuloplanes atrovinosus]|uniref:DNA-binding transcriptional MerR regulator n=1 Tax=Catenuloplanes atrovinosus TaxID=137266 RepID=A0AAE3YME2_9ACTN|nr:MerR family transcriptional regulator [Catenuloplanes atrovinosus]MDR7274869.1 DNA-binding transcriptional MerR regulator [Catenuloplanes atrovinosus]